MRNDDGPSGDSRRVGIRNAGQRPWRRMVVRLPAGRRRRNREGETVRRRGARHQRNRSHDGGYHSHHHRADGEARHRDGDDASPPGTARGSCRATAPWAPDAVPRWVPLRGARWLPPAPRHRLRSRSRPVAPVRAPPCMGHARSTTDSAMKTPNQSASAAAPNRRKHEGRNMRRTYRLASGASNAPPLTTRCASRATLPWPWESRCDSARRATRRRASAAAAISCAVSHMLSSSVIPAVEACVASSSSAVTHVRRPARVAVDAGVLPHHVADARRPPPAPRRGRRSGGTSHVAAPAAGRRAARRVRHVARHAFGEDEPLQQRVGRETVRPVHAGARHLAAGVQARQRRAPGEVGDDPAHHVVRRRRHRDEVAPRIDARGAGRGAKIPGKRVHEVLADLARVEEDRRPCAAARERSRAPRRHAAPARRACVAPP